MGTFTIMSPVSPPRVTDQPLAPRPTTLDGLTVAFLDNQKANAFDLLSGVATSIASRFEDVTVVEEKKIATSPSPEEVMGRLHECDAVVLAIAD